MLASKDKSGSDKSRVARSDVSTPKRQEELQSPFVDRRPDATLQREIADAIDASPNQTAQRQQISAMFSDSDSPRQNAFESDTDSGAKRITAESSHQLQRSGESISRDVVQRAGSGARKRGKFMERRQIMYIAQTKPEGFTLNLKDLYLTDLADMKADPKNVDVILKKFTNYCVAYNETQESFGEEGLKKVIEHAYSHAGYVGGWKEKGKFYFDSVRVVASEYNAIEAAIKEQQDAYFDLNGRVVRVRDKRDGPIRPDIIEKLKSLGKKLTELGVDADVAVPKSEASKSPYI